MFTNLSLCEQGFFWFFREYIYESFYITSEKFFMTNKEFRNICIFKSFKIILTISIWLYLLNLLEVLCIIFILINISLILIYCIIDTYFKKDSLKLNFFLITPLFLILCFNAVPLYSKNDIYIILYSLFGFVYLLFILVTLTSYLKLFLDLFNFNNHYFFYTSFINKNLFSFSLKTHFKITIFLRLILTISIFYVFNYIFNYEIINSHNFYQELLLVSYFYSMFIKIF